MQRLKKYGVLLAVAVVWFFLATLFDWSTRSDDAYYFFLFIGLPSLGGILLYLIVRDVWGAGGVRKFVKYGVLLAVAILLFAVAMLAESWFMWYLCIGLPSLGGILLFLIAWDVFMPWLKRRKQKSP